MPTDHVRLLLGTFCPPNLYGYFLSAKLVLVTELGFFEATLETDDDRIRPWRRFYIDLQAKVAHHMLSGEQPILSWNEPDCGGQALFVSHIILYQLIQELSNTIQEDILKTIPVDGAEQINANISDPIGPAAHAEAQALGIGLDDIDDQGDSGDEDEDGQLHWDLDNPDANDGDE